MSVFLWNDDIGIACKYWVCGRDANVGRQGMQTEAQYLFRAAILKIACRTKWPKWDWKALSKGVPALSKSCVAVPLRPVSFKIPWPGLPVRGSAMGIGEQRRLIGTMSHFLCLGL